MLDWYLFTSAVISMTVFLYSKTLTFYCIFSDQDVPLPLCMVLSMPRK